MGVRNTFPSADVTNMFPHYNLSPAVNIHRRHQCTRSSSASQNDYRLVSVLIIVSDTLLIFYDIDTFSAENHEADHVLGCVCLCAVKFSKQYVSKTIRWVSAESIADTPCMLPWKLLISGLAEITCKLAEKEWAKVAIFRRIIS